MKLLDDLIVGRAQSGDFDPLIEYLKRGHELTPEMYKFLVNVFLKGKLPRSKNKKGVPRIKKSKVRDRNIAITVFVEERRRIW